MCGFCGVIGPARLARLDRLEAMSGAIAHRGPDDSGTWQRRVATAGRDDVVALGHRRLAILDLSPLGHQPMSTPDGRLTIAFNGEIYNFLDLRRILEQEGASFRSNTDTEVILAAFSVWGEESFRRLNGMFAFALFDTASGRLHLVRDRAGIKPLYYHDHEGLLIFGSELKSLRMHPEFVSEVDRGALGRYLRHGYVSGEETIYARTKRLLPGDHLVWEAGTIRVGPYVRWDAPPDEPSPTSFDDVVVELGRLLGDAVERQMISDVPIGAFLSGGVDSSTVVALMQERATQRVRTFSIGFEHERWNEAPFARAVAEHLQTEHTELYVTRQDAIDVAEELPAIYDEPFADPSAIPTILLARLTRKHVTVALSGDGGDELFGGYGHHQRFHQLLPWLGLPAMLRRPLSSASRFLPAGALRNALAHLRARDPAELALRLLSSFDGESLERACGPEGGRPTPLYLEAFRSAVAETNERRTMVADARVYLPDDILAKVDRATMSVALEARVPILDNEVLRFGLALPLDIIWHGGVAKAPLRALLYRYVPRELIERPKHGFGIPLHVLLAERIDEWTAEFLAPRRLKTQGILDPAGVAGLIGEAGARFDAVVRASVIWRLLCFQRWFAYHHEGRRPA